MTDTKKLSEEDLDIDDKNDDPSIDLMYENLTREDDRRSRRNEIAKAERCLAKKKKT